MMTDDQRLRLTVAQMNLRAARGALLAAAKLLDVENQDNPADVGYVNTMQAASFADDADEKLARYVAAKIRFSEEDPPPPA